MSQPKILDGTAYAKLVEAQLLQRAKKITEIAKSNSLKCQTIAEPASTGTNANVIQLLREGIPSVVIGVPVKNMHTQNEIVSIEDIDSAVDLICAIVK